MKTQTERFGQAGMQAPRLSEPKEPRRFKQSWRGHQRTTQEQCASDREGKTRVTSGSGTVKGRMCPPRGGMRSRGEWANNNGGDGMLRREGEGEEEKQQN